MKADSCGSLDSRVVCIVDSAVRANLEPECLPVVVGICGTLDYEPRETGGYGTTRQASVEHLRVFADISARAHNVEVHDPADAYVMCRFRRSHDRVRCQILGYGLLNSQVNIPQKAALVLARVHV